MEMQFRALYDERKILLTDYIRDYSEENPGCSIHIGCDSQNVSTNTIYVTALVFRFPNNGAHVLYRKEKVGKIEDMWTKLWGELERSIELANVIKDHCGITVDQIDLDYNEDPNYPSHKLLSAARGYAEAMGYEAKAKPHLLMAAWIADVLCHR